MKTPEEWLMQEQGAVLGFSVIQPHEMIDVIRRIQKDAQPKWVTGEEAAKWPDGVLILIQTNGSNYPLVWRKTNETYYAASNRFLRLDDLLNQEWPK